MDSVLHVEAGLSLHIRGKIKSVKLSGRTLYFNGHALRKLKGRQRGFQGGSYFGDDGEYWVSGVKKNGEDRHWAGARSWDPSRYEVTHSIVPTGIEKFHGWENSQNDAARRRQPHALPDRESDA
jgi:hypothetical protein